MSPVVRYMPQPSGDGYLLPGWYGAEQRRHCVSVTHTKKKKMVAIHEALAKCSAENPVFSEDEVDIHLNPKIGADWQLRGQQNVLSHRARMKSTILPGRRTAVWEKVSYVGVNSKGSSLFIRLLKHLKATYRRAKTITLIVDNYIIHKAVKRCAG